MPAFAIALGAADTNTMATLLTTLTVVFTSLMTCVADACSTIVGQPFLLFTTGILFAGAVIGIIGRILSRS